MSKANGVIENKDTFLQHVSLKNYKSIKDIEIDFKPGLNVIIGKNGSGKTNFINGVNSILNVNYKELYDSEFTITALFKNDKLEIKASSKNEGNVDLDYYSPTIYHSMSLIINEDLKNVKDYNTLKEELSKYGLHFNSILIKYGSHYKDNAQFINIPSSFVLFNNGRVSRELMMITMDDNRTEFINSFAQILNLKLYQLHKNDTDKYADESKLKDDINLSTEELFSNINALIYLYSPIKKIRINQDFNILYEDLGKRIIVTNFYLEFFIDENWMPFGLLSDGTKRLFYIVSEILATYDNFNSILLEEPELGIHPHQLHQLMEFIKEQSKNRQIILTTHSPQVLDALEHDELDRIIICHSDPKSGTQLNHLTEQQIKKAKKYMTSKAFLSDYWRFSDLEPA